MVFAKEVDHRKLILKKLAFIVSFQPDSVTFWVTAIPVLEKVQVDAVVPERDKAGVAADEYMEKSYTNTSYDCAAINGSPTDTRKKKRRNNIWDCAGGM